MGTLGADADVERLWCAASGTLSPGRSVEGAGLGGVPDSGMVAAVGYGLCSLWLKTLGGSEADRSSLGEASAAVIVCLGLPLAGSCVVFLGDPPTGCFLWPMCTTLMGIDSDRSLSALDLG